MPIISSISPSTGSAGDTVILYGSNFSPLAANNEVCFGTGAATVLAGDADSLLAEVPANATTGRVKVTVNYLEAYSPSPFTLGPACAAAKGDLTGYGGKTPADVGKMLLCVYTLGYPGCDLCFSDVNCSGDLTPADVALELLIVYLLLPPPC